MTTWITGLNQGLFRSGLAGQANAILVDPESRATDLGQRADQRRRTRAADRARRAGRARNDDRRREPARVERLPRPGDTARRGSPGTRVRRRGSARPARPSCSRVTSTSPTRSSAATREPGGRDRRRARARRVVRDVTDLAACERRMQDGVVLSDHAPVDCVCWSSRRDVRRGPRALPRARDGGIPQRRHVRPARAAGGRRPRGRARARPRAGPERASVLRGDDGPSRGVARRVRGARRRRAGAGRPHELDDRGVRDRRPRPRAPARGRDRDDDRRALRPSRGRSPSPAPRSWSWRPSPTRSSRR